jgi:hypothetical protein
MKFVHSDVLDGGLNALKSGAIRVALIKAYTLGDSLSTINSNKLAEATMASADFTLASSGNNRTLTTTAKSATATATQADVVSTRAATGGSATTLVDTTQSWTTNDKAGFVVTGVAGAGAGRSEVIISNTGTTLTFATGTAFDNTSTYRINYNLHLAYHDNSAKVLAVTDETSNLGVTTGDTVNFGAVVLTNVQPI